MVLDEPNFIRKRKDSLACYKLPEGYFDTLCRHVLERIDARKHKDKAKILRLRTIVTVAASVLLLVVGGYFFITRSHVVTPNVTTPDEACALHDECESFVNDALADSREVVILESTFIDEP